MEQLLQYENLVRSIVNQYGNKNDKEDLYQVGMIGLMKAYKNYDENQETKFSTYAYYYILGEVTKYIRENKVIRVSKDLIKLNKSIEHAREVMSQRLGRLPTDTEVALFLEVDEEKIKQATIATNEIKSLDYCYEEEQNNLYNSIKVEDKSTNESILDLKMELSNLSKEERNLIVDRYFEEMTQTETSKKLGLSQVQVSRQEAKILQKLKQRLVA